jgi:hypothetical protein
VEEWGWYLCSEPACRSEFKNVEMASRTPFHHCWSDLQDRLAELVHSVSHYLHSTLKILKVYALENEVCDVGEGVVLGGEKGVEIAGEAAGVILVIAVYVFGVGKVQGTEVECDI